MDCPGCGGNDLIKAGPKDGAQRYRCRACGRYMTDRVRRFSTAVKAQALDMYLNNVGIRKIARFTGASPAGVLRWIRKAHTEVLARAATLPAVGEAAAPDIIEMDELYTIIQKKPAAPSSGPPSAGV
jgi:transposase-like protein